MTLPQGALVGGRYRIERVLGEGGMAIVYAATHVHTEQRCAVKLVRDDVARRHPGLVEKFVAEAKVTARIGQCQYIVQVTDADMDKERGVPFLAMELLSGETLEALIARGPVPRDLVRVLFEQLGEALGLAHAAGVVHRDLKPGNLFLTYDRKRHPILKVTDFGIAKILADGPPSTGTQIGTPGYGAPEQLGLVFAQLVAAQGVTIARAVSPQTDVWPLGLIAYDLLTAHPYGQLWGVSSGEIAVVTVMSAAPRASERARERAHLLPDGFDAWCARCLERDATKRWGSAGECVEALLALLPASSTVYSSPSTVVSTPMSRPVAWTPSLPTQPTTATPVVRAATAPMHPPVSVASLDAAWPSRSDEIARGVDATSHAATSPLLPVVPVAPLLSSPTSRRGRVLALLGVGLALVAGGVWTLVRGAAPTSEPSKGELHEASARATISPNAVDAAVAVHEVTSAASSTSTVGSASAAVASTRVGEVVHAAATSSDAVAVRTAAPKPAMAIPPATPSVIDCRKFEPELEKKIKQIEALGKKILNDPLASPKAQEQAQAALKTADRLRTESKAKCCSAPATVDSTGAERPKLGCE
ncbi:MAG: serine/threonine protein kinase [Polyangiales bacterium]